jgi:hypothetical protein
VDPFFWASAFIILVLKIRSEDRQYFNTMALAKSISMSLTGGELCQLVNNKGYFRTFPGSLAFPALNDGAS